MSRTLTAALLAFALCASAQLPAPRSLSATDLTQFHAEVARIEKLLASALDRAAVTYQLARTWASAGQWPEVVKWLRAVAALKSGHDPSRDRLFAPIRDTREFNEILAAIRASTPPVSHSTPAFQVNEADLVPESLAYDAKANQFYFGSLRKGKVIRCSAKGECSDFARGLGVVIGLRISAGSLWLVSNSENESALISYALDCGRATGTYKVKGAGHLLNDIEIAPSGDVYVTDTRAGTVWRLPANGATELTPIPGRFTFANGLALSPEADLLYVSAWPDGILVVDLKDGAAAPIARPNGLSLAGIDGLYFHRGSLIAIQNAFMVPRVIRLTLTKDMHAIAKSEVLERRHPLFDGVTTGVIAGREFFYMANMQIDRKDNFTPINILKIGL